MFPDRLYNKLNDRVENDSLRTLGRENNLVDFSSNDYLGFAKSDVIFKKTNQFLIKNDLVINGSTGSRLLSGNHSLYNELESQLCNWHQSDAALVFNSGYSANLGLFSSVPQRGDVVLYDEYSHASIRDGIRLSNAKAYKFQHNNLADLEGLLKKFQNKNDEIYVVTESVFSMDGDSPYLSTMLQMVRKYNAHFIVDEAHSLGVFKYGLVQELGLEKEVFARVVTYGKALGCHGAVILGDQKLKEFLINFSRPFIYTTALSPHSLATIKCSYEELIVSNAEEKLHENIRFFVKEIERLSLNKIFIQSKSAIQSCVISGNKKVRQVAKHLHDNGTDVKPILSPTVPIGEERLRFCLHSYNTHEEITKVLELLCNLVLTNQ